MATGPFASPGPAEDVRRINGLCGFWTQVDTDLECPCPRHCPLPEDTHRQPLPQAVSAGHEVLMLLSLAAAVVLAAQPSSPWLSEARALVEQLRFGDAIARLEIARQVRSLDPSQRREVLELLAYCQVAEGKREAAEATYTSMLQSEPWFELSKEESSPKVLEAFDAAKKKLFPPDYVRLEQKTSAPGWAALALTDPWRQVRSVIVFQRRDGGEWKEEVLTEEADRAYRFPLSVSGDEKLEWYVEANSEVAVVARIATREAPRVLKIARPDPVVVVAPVAQPASGARVAGFVTMGLGVALAAVATGLAVSGTNTRQAARDRTRPPGDFADTARLAERDGQAQQTWSVGLFIGAGVAVGTGVVLAW